MDTKRIKGLQVITLAGMQVGKVEQIFFDPATKHIAGFILQVDPYSPDGSPRIVDSTLVHAFGVDALTLPDDLALGAAATNIQLDSMVLLDELSKRQVVTESGTSLGQIASIEIDPATLQLSRIEVSPGFFKSNIWIADDQITQLGMDAIMVADAIATPELTPPVEATLPLAAV